MDLEAKTLAAVERDEAARERHRRRMRRVADRVGADRLVFVDETGVTTAMTRRRARAPRGRRAHGAVPRNRGTVTTVLTSLSAAGMGPAMAVEGGTSTAVFLAYLERVLVPTLAPGQVVVMDNLAAHRSRRVAEVVHAAGCQLVYLPAYSPDLNPIEEANALVKARLRAAGARTRPSLDRAVADALGAVTPADARGWLAHAGYCAQPS